MAEYMLTLAVSPDGRWVAASGYNHVIYLWDLHHAGLAGKCVGHTKPVGHLVFSPDSETLISNSPDGTARFWHVKTQMEMLAIGSQDARITSIRVNPKGDRLVMGVELPGNQFGVRMLSLGIGGTPAQDVKATPMQR
jgi:WD40 repeat protein